MTPNQRFSELLKKHRQRSGLSQSRLAEASGVPLQTIQAYEHGRILPSWQKVCALAKALEVSLTAFDLNK